MDCVTCYMTFMLHLSVITPKKIVLEEDVDQVTAPSAEGEITVLPRHSNLFSLLKEGIITIKTKQKEESIAIGAGYLQTDGTKIRILVSRAYGQDEIDEKLTEKALAEARAILAKSKDTNERRDATALLRRSTIDLKLLKRRRRS